MEPWMWIIIIVVVVVSMSVGFVFRTATLIRTAVLGNRFDDDHTLHYFTKDDFEGLEKEDFTFPSNGYDLAGYHYFIKDSQKKGTIVFAHGIGAGHIQYTTEINYFAQIGYDVYAFDAQGCLASPGNGIEYFTNYVQNLDDFMTYLENKEELKEEKFILIGHSLGGYGVNLMPAFHQERILKIISMSGFNDEKALIGDILNNVKIVGKIITKILINQEKKHNESHNLTSIKAMENMTSPVLFVSGDKDSLVKPEHSFNLYKETFKDKENFYFLLVENRAHRPMLSIKAAEYDEKRTRDLDELKMTYKNKIPDEILSKYYNELDYHLLVELDPKVMDIMVQFLNDELKDRDHVLHEDVIEEKEEENEEA